MDNKNLQYPLDGILDLHTFRPCDAGDVTREYLFACYRKGLRQVRIIHGKGTGAIRATVHSVLAQSSLVAGWRTPTDRSGWGATIVALKSRSDPEHAGDPQNCSEYDGQKYPEDPAQTH